MAQQLKETHGLLALKVTLAFWERENTTATLQLESGAASLGDPKGVDVPVTALGATLEPGAVEDAALPADVLDRLRQALQSVDAPLDHPIWLHLVKPYGVLGAAPWERLLAPLGRPVLRLPDFLERPRENTRLLDVAICWEPGPEASAEEAVVDLCRLADTILKSSPREQTTVHVFASEDWSRPLRARLKESRVQIHRPPSTWFGPKRKTSSISASSWLDWICEGIGKGSLDAVHFVCDARESRDGASLVLSSSPSESPASKVPVYIEVEALSTFLNRTGAWSTIFTPPRGGGSESLVRFYADRLAQARPGPVLFHDGRRLDEPDELAHLAQAYRFLFSPAPAIPPSGASMFIYCQPALVESVQPAACPVLEAVSANAKLLESAGSEPPRALRAALSKIGLGSRDETPSWLSATQRYVEGAAMDARRESSTDVLLTGLVAELSAADAPDDGTIKPSTDAVLAQTLEQIQAVVRDYAVKKGMES